MVSPAFERQRQFNSALVDHANRTAADALTRYAALQGAIETLKAQAGARARFDSHLIQFLQTVTWYVDTKDRQIESASLVLNAALSGISDDWMKRWESLKTREDRLLKEVQALGQSFEATQATSALTQQTAISLKRDVEALLARSVAVPSTETPATPTALAGGRDAALPLPDLDAFKYLSFENEFRGSRDDIRQRLSAYLPRFAGKSDVLEIGCGRGEFLDLLREHGIRARGLDINDAMVRETQDRGLDAVRADALEYLQAQPDASLGGLFAAQVVEHLTPAYLGRLIDIAGQKLRPGGVLVFETINPTCWLAFFESYIRDLTHVKPLHPDTLRFLVRAAGFSRVEIEFKAAVPEAQRLPGLPWTVVLDDAASQDTLRAIVSRINEQTSMLNDRLFGYQDYAVIGEK
jgi:SAM-dependent methyltransferase